MPNLPPPAAAAAAAAATIERASACMLVVPANHGIDVKERGH
jgi:mannose-1-phosphate guanylyltransferase